MPEGRSSSRVQKKTTPKPVKNTTIQIFAAWKTLHIRYLNRIRSFADGILTRIWVTRWFDRKGDTQIGSWVHTNSIINEDVVSEGKTETA